MARSFELQKICCTLTVCHPPWHDHLCYLGYLHHFVLFRVYPDLQWLSDAGLLNDLHLPASLLARFRRGHLSGCGSQVPTLVPHSIAWPLPELQDLLHLGLEEHIPRLRDHNAEYPTLQ